MSHLSARRDRYAAALDPGDAVILIGAGQPIHMPGGFDRTYPYLAHPDYFVLAEQECPGAVLAYDAATGWAHFAPPVTKARRVWDGDVSFEGDDIAGLESYLDARKGRPIAALGAPHPGVKADEASTERMRHRMAAVRRTKDEAEIERIKRAVAVTKNAYDILPDLCAERHPARRIKIEIEAAMLRAGADRMAYDTTVGVGPDAAVFHFTPGERAPGPDEAVLIDAGAECDRYCADVTRVYPVTAFNGAQQELYEAVLGAELAAIDACGPGTEWHDVHRTAAESLARSLAEIGMVTGDPTTLVDRGVIALFFPHGVGHMVGLGVRDAGGVLEGRPTRKGPGGTSIRVDLPLEAGHVVTVEPGLYFVPALLDDAETRTGFADAIDWPLVDKLRTEIQGIRIEDDILITPAGHEILTSAIPK